MRSLLFQEDATPFTEPVGCDAGRQEVQFAVRKNGRIYRFVVRDKLLPEDFYLVNVRAAAFAVQTGEPFAGKDPDRGVKDFLIKESVVI